MPIDYSQYHPEWKTRIRPAILARAGNHCERCGVQNHSLVRRWKQNPAVYEYHPERLDHIYLFECDASDWSKWLRVILTVAHVDYDRTNNRYANLRAWCQRCHLRHDRNHHHKRKDTHG